MGLSKIGNYAASKNHKKSNKIYPKKISVDEVVLLKKLKTTTSYGKSLFILQICGCITRYLIRKGSWEPHLVMQLGMATLKKAIRKHLKVATF